MHRDGFEQTRLSSNDSRHLNRELSLVLPLIVLAAGAHVLPTESKLESSAGKTYSAFVRQVDYEIVAPKLDTWRREGGLNLLQ